jgi:hypothetical protein
MIMEAMDSPVDEKALGGAEGEVIRTGANIPSDKKGVDMTSAEKVNESSITSSGEETISPDSNEVVSTANDIVTHIIRVEDDPTISPWTFRMVFLGIVPYLRPLPNITWEGIVIYTLRC